jgi:hypothetical protein
MHPVVPMGKVLTSLTIVNRADQILAKYGRISPEKIRSVDLIGGSSRCSGRYGSYNALPAGTCD